MRTLVVYYSRSGNTKRVANEIAVALGADLEAIVDHTQRMGALGYLRCGYEATFEVAAQIDAPHKNPADYDLVVVGTPVWNASVASPVRAYLKKYSEHIASLALFCTEGGRGGEDALRQMAILAEQSPVGELVLTERDLADAAAWTALLVSFSHRVLRRGGAVPPVRDAGSQALRHQA